MDEKYTREINSIAHVGQERATLSIALSNPELLFDIALRLKPHEYTNIANRRVYEIMLSILDDKHDNIHNVNSTVIHSIAQNSGVDEDIGGLPYLRSLEEMDAGEENLGFYIERVKQASVRRESYKKGLTVLEDAVKCDNIPIKEFTSRQEEKFLDIVMDNTDDKNEIVKIGDGIDSILDERVNNPREILGIRTGFPEFDRATGGLVPGRLKVVASPAKTGKSILGLNVGINVASGENIPVLYVDLEMNTSEQIDRTLSILGSETGIAVPEKVITSGMYAKNPKMKDAIDNYARPMIKEMPLYHKYEPNYTPDGIFNLARKFQRQHGVEWNGKQGQFVMILDYLKMSEEDFQNGNRKEYEILGQVTNMLKNKIAGQLDIPVLGFAQLDPRKSKGADDVDSSFMSGSNRIVMMVSELSFLRKKTDRELEEDGRDGGDLVWKLGETRHGGSYEGWLQTGKPKGVPSLNEIRNVALE